MPDPAAPPAARDRRRPLKWAVALLSVALLAWLVDWRGSVALLGRLEPGWALAGAALDVACILLSSWKWQRLLEALSTRIRLPALFRAYWIGAFVSSFLPSTIGGDVVRAAVLRRAGGVGPVGSSIIVERLTGFGTLLAIVLVVVLARPDLVAHGSLRAVVALSIGGGCAALLLMTVLLLRPHRAIRPVAEGRRSPLDRARAVLAHLEAGLAAYARRGRALLAACAVSVVFYGLIALFQYAVIRSLGVEVALADVMAIAPLVTLMAALPLSPNGIGVSEGVFVLLYTQVGLTPEEALAAAVVRRVLLTITALAGGALWLASRGEGAAEAEAEAPAKA